MKIRGWFALFAVSLLIFTGCSSGNTAEPDDTVDDQLNQIMAAKTRYALAKIAAPVLNTHDWDLIFGGSTGKDLKYDRYGEVDELVFVALPNTFFNIQRQVRKETRSGAETIYYKVTTPDYSGNQSLWIDGRFLDLRDIKPQETRSPHSAITTLINLRRMEGLSYTWHGSHAEGVPELLEYYPPSEELTLRQQNDWSLKGVDSLGMLYYASNGGTPLDMGSLANFGEAVYPDLSDVKVDEDNDDPNARRIQQAQLLLKDVRPLDIIQMGERVWIVLDGGEVAESRYESKFSGEVRITSLFDTLYGLLQKGVLVKNPFEELADPQAKRFFIRRYMDTSSLLEEAAEADEDEVLDEEETEDGEDVEKEEEETTQSSGSDESESTNG